MPTSTDDPLEPASATVSRPPPSDSVQGELFARTGVVLRQVGTSGATFRLRLEPLGDGMVRVIEAERRAPGGTSFKNVPSEVGRVVRFEQLGLATHYDALFGGVD